ncbi:helix-turn-helix transcriptional regulator [Capillimicrobium parvum]|nr:LuxR C-terminal-related transcriptional regulator [Capillimicrobium parvum]
MTGADWSDIARFGETVCETLRSVAVQRRALPAFTRLTSSDSGGIYVFDHRYRATMASIVGAPSVLLYEFEELGRRDCTYMQRSMASRFPVHDAMLHPTSRAHRNAPQGRLLQKYGLEHCMLIPLIRNGRTVGAVSIARETGRPPFSIAEQRVADRLARFVSIALINAALHEAIAGVDDDAVAVSGDGDRDGDGDSVETVRMRDEAGVARYAARRRKATALRGTLSAREIEVFELMATGLTNAEMAGELNIAVNTVKQHVKQIFRKLGARSRLEAVHHGYGPPVH